jgi:pyruvate formate lyase activating enzyme
MDVKSVPQHNRYQQITPINEEAFRNVLRSITVLKQNRVPYEFRTTQIPKLHSEEDMAEIKAFLEGKAPYKIQHFREADIVANYAAS